MKHIRFVILLVLALSVTRPIAEARPNILVCLADDWSYGHAGVYGDKVVKTPAFDRVAREGVLFHHAFSSAPSCTPSRAAILTGQYPHRLEEGGQLHGFLPQKFPNYVNLLEAAGYAVGLTSKGWGPGRAEVGGYARNPAGPTFRDFASFLATLAPGQPFCFWLGSTDPHRPYKKGSGVQSGMDPAAVRVSGYWPDAPATRGDVLDYYFAVQRFDSSVGHALALLEKSGRLYNTLVVISGDNGMPFPRCKANLYDGGTRQPLAIRWPARVRRGRVSYDFVNLMDLAPTFLEAASLSVPARINGRSLMPLLEEREPAGTRDRVFLERERHGNFRANGGGYPARAIRTADFLYIRNFAPDRWPAGDPVAPVPPGRTFGDVDDGPTKELILTRRDDPEMSRFFALSFGQRPAEELYDVRSDPDNVRNLAADPNSRAMVGRLRMELDDWMRATGDPRVLKPNDDRWDKYPYFGGGASKR